MDEEIAAERRLGRDRGVLIFHRPGDLSEVGGRHSCPGDDPTILDDDRGAEATGLADEVVEVQPRCRDRLAGPGKTSIEDGDLGEEGESLHGRGPCQTPQGEAKIGGKKPASREELVLGSSVAHSVR